MDSKDAMQAADAAAIVAISTAIGFPVPPSVAQNVLISVGALVTSALAVPTAWLEGLAKTISATTEARARVTAGAVPVVVDEISSDSELRKRAALFLGGRMLREQKNREAVVAEAIQELRVTGTTDATPEGSGAIDDDWLNLFGRLAETRSDEAMRAYFARILAGEIRRPGSYTPATLEVLSRMTPADADNFRALCGLLVELRSLPDSAETIGPVILAAPYGPPGGNALKSLGFSYGKLCELQDSGILQRDLEAWREFSALTFLTHELSVASQRVRFSPAGVIETNMRRCGCINLTRAGRELFRIAVPQPNPPYVERVLEWIETNFSVSRIPIEQRIAESKAG